VAALLFGLPLYMLLFRKTPDRGAASYVAAGAAIGVAVYAVIAGVLTIYSIVTFAFGDVLWFLYVTRFFAGVGLACGAASGLAFWLVAIRGREGA
jgi:hypothetical protein